MGRAKKSIRACLMPVLSSAGQPFGAYEKSQPCPEPMITKDFQNSPRPGVAIQHPVA
jgi:hypothetical protein